MREFDTEDYDMETLCTLIDRALVSAREKDMENIVNLLKEMRKIVEYYLPSI